jgi:thymidylate synthase
MWKKLVQPDGAILSNYGYYWFGPQNGFKWVCDTLKADPASRQAYIAMNNYSHAYPGNPDFVCTKGIQFRIKYGLVNMHVAMRSSDAIYGLGTDLPCFYTLWHMVCKELDRAPGKFIFSADSVHIYERHFEMTENIIKYDYDVDDILAPMPTITDVNDLLEGRYESKFGCWLMEAPL